MPPAEWATDWRGNPALVVLNCRRCEPGLYLRSDHLHPEWDGVAHLNPNATGEDSITASVLKFFGISWQCYGETIRNLDTTSVPNCHHHWQLYRGGVALCYVGATIQDAAAFIWPYFSDDLDVLTEFT